MEKYYNSLIFISQKNTRKAEVQIMKKRVVVALGHRALGTTLPEQKEAVKKTAKVIGDLIEKGYQVAITHSNAPQVGMIHKRRAGK